MLAVPKDALWILQRLNANGYEAYVVGGCVRDSLLSLPVHDWDITTNASPQQVSGCFSGEKIIETGLQHGTVTLLKNSVPYEITTYRVDGDYTDHRHPDSVSFTTSLTDDLSRRDFTINAMAYHPEQGIVDPFGGQADLAGGVLRCVGDAGARFSQDALRILRALRFSAVYGFEIEEQTAAAVHSARALLRHIAAERICSELMRLLCGAHVEAVLNAFWDVLCVFIPELAPLEGFEQHSKHHRYDVKRHTAKAVALVQPEPALRLTMLLHDIAKPACFSRDAHGGHFYGHPQKSGDMAREILHRLRCDNDTTVEVVTLVLYHDMRISPQKKTVRRWLGRLGEARMRALIQVQRADQMAQSSYLRAEKKARLDDLEACVNEIVAAQLCVCLRDLAVNGRDLLAAGFAQGEQVGTALSRLLEDVIDERLPNERTALLQAAQQMLTKL